jgi:hypothetical protein
MFKKFSLDTWEVYWPIQKAINVRSRYQLRPGNFSSSW